MSRRPPKKPPKTGQWAGSVNWLVISAKLFTGTAGRPARIFYFSRAARRVEALKAGIKEPAERVAA